MKTKLLKTTVAFCLTTFFILGISFADLLTAAKPVVQLNDEAIAIMQQLQVQYPDLKTNGLKEKILAELQRSSYETCTRSCNSYGKPGSYLVLFGRKVCFPCSNP